MAILDHALEWAGRGFRVFPLRPGDKVPPRGLPWKVEATTDADKIRSWWAFNPAYNYAVAAGAGVLLVDVDAAKGGYASLLDIELPAETLTVQTPGGGVHIYLTGPDVENSVDRLAPGIDVRSAGGYVVGPGSFFADPDGKKGYTGEYRILLDAPLAAAPPSVVQLAGAPRTRHSTVVSVDNPDDVVFALHYLLKDAPVSVEGRGGNNTAYAVAARLIEIGMSAETAAELMQEHWNPRCQPPWEREEVARFAANAQAYAQAGQGSGGVSAAAAEFEGAQPLPPETAAGKFDALFRQRTLTPLERIPARSWVAHGLLLRNEATVVSGPGGVGKSGLALLIAALGAAGRSFGDYHVGRPFSTLVYNLEDTRHEMEARLYAICAAHDLDPREVERRVLLWPGREMRFRLFRRDRTVAMPDIQELARLLRAQAFDVGIFDPLMSLHHEEENDNTAMADVLDAANGLCRLANIAGVFIQHTAKGVRAAGSADAARGAGAIVTSVRIAATLYAADEADAVLHGFGEGYKARYVRMDDAKSNVSELGTKPLWLEKQSFPLPSGDTSYALRRFEASATQAGEGKLIAEILVEHMRGSGIANFPTYDAAKVLANTHAYFRDRVPASGNLSQLKTLIELRLARPTLTDRGDTLRVEVKTDPGSNVSRAFITLA